MTQSELEAAVAALSELGMPYEPQGVFVSEVDEGSPAAGDLVPGDIITAVDSRDVRTLEELTDALSDRPAGDTVRLGVRRGSRTLELRVDTAEAEDGASRLGAELVQYNKAPIDVSISSRDIGGPSAGLMYALSIYDRLVPEDITGGRKIAGTGTIENPAGRSGVVGAVGSVELKVKGASRIGAGVFLVPKPELDEARAAAGSGMEVIGVSTLKEAITELKRLPPTKVAQKKT
ncbi:MAG TPA: PDZ domain-containing protein [Actinomycetota bacterium]|nr:PDZ domain-containing protein [Actinomycetota bacterium]